MRHSDNSFQRTNEISRENSKKSNWLEEFAEKLAVEDVAVKAPQIKEASAKTAVEVARQQAEPSVYHMMSSIISPNKPKFSSVEDVVQHYQDKTGLKAHIQRKAKASLLSAAALIVAAGGKDCGHPDEDQCDCDAGSAEDSMFPSRDDEPEFGDTESILSVVEDFESPDDDCPGGGSKGIGALLRELLGEDVEDDPTADDTGDVRWDDSKKV